MRYDKSVQEAFKRRLARLAGVAAFLIISICFSYGQSRSSTPSPTPPPDNDVVKISTNLIQIDVSVTDAKGKVITDLKPEEIEIYENGQKQKITNIK